ncbi:MAG: mechanosensitive ion channel family protein [Waterburya sp.]
MIRRIIRILALQLSIGLLALTLVLTWDFPTVAQMTPDLNWSEDSISPESYIPVFTIGNLEISPVFLDGKMLGTVESFVNLRVGDSQFDRHGSAIRSHVIHSKLQKILDNMTRYSRDVLPHRGILELEAQERELRKQLTIDVSEKKETAVVLISFPKNDVPEILYTVTQATVARPRFGGSQPLKIAERTAKIAENALIQAWRERQTSHLFSQGRHGLLVFLVLTVTSLSLRWGQKRLNSKKRRINNSLYKAGNVQLQDNSISDSSPVTVESPKIAQPLQQIPFEQTLFLRQSYSLNIFYRTVLFWFQWLMWMIGIGYLSSLFYKTRPLSNWIIGVTINGAWGSKAINHWPPVDWFLTLGQKANLALPLLILLLLLISRLILTGGDFFIDFLIRRWSEEQSNRKALRLPTLSRALKGWLKVFVSLLIGVTLLYHLHQLGTITQAIAVFLGFASFALSLASQNLLKDLIGGLLILWEDQYAVGDVIVLGDQGGLVEKITLRVTQLRNLDGELITFPNGSIEMVRNLSSDWSQVNYAIEVGYDNDVDRVMEVIEEVAQQLYGDPQWQENILEAPEILGIENISHTGILIRLIIKTQPLQQWPVAREFRRRLKKEFDQQGIEVGIPQQMMYFGETYPKSKTYRVSDQN